MIIAGATVTSEASRQAVLKAIARARTWYEQLTTGKTGSIAKLAAKYGVTPTLYPNAHKAGSTEPAVD